MLAVVVILGILSSFAIPIFTTVIESTKKDAHISNALHIVEAVKMYIGTEKIEVTEGKEINLAFLIIEEYLTSIKDPNSNFYYDTSSFVKVNNDGKEYLY